MYNLAAITIPSKESVVQRGTDFIISTKQKQSLRFRAHLTPEIGYSLFKYTSNPTTGEGFAEDVLQIKGGLSSQESTEAITKWLTKYDIEVGPWVDLDAFIKTLVKTLDGIHTPLSFGTVIYQGSQTEENIELNFPLGLDLNINHIRERLPTGTLPVIVCNREVAEVLKKLGLPRHPGDAVVLGDYRDYNRNWCYIVGLEPGNPTPTIFDVVSQLMDDSKETTILRVRYGVYSKLVVSRTEW